VIFLFKKHMEYQLCYKVIPMPCDTNFNGDIFGGWLLSQMDLAGVSLCNNVSYGRYVTLTIDRMVFRKPVKVGDIVEIKGKIIPILKNSKRVFKTINKKMYIRYNFSFLFNIFFKNLTKFIRI